MTKNSFFSNLSAEKVKKAAVVFIVFLVVVAFIPGVVYSFFNTQSAGGLKDTHWVQVNDKFVTDTMVLSDYRQAVQQNSQYIAQNPELLNNIFNDVLQRYATSMLYATAAEDLNIKISDETIYKIISGLPQLQNEQGYFDANAFSEAVTSYFGSEEAFIQTIKNSILQDSFLSSFVTLLKGNNYVSYLDFLAIAQKRNVSYITLSNKDIKIAKNEKPTDEELTKIRDDNKDFFTTPENRTGEVLVIKKETVEKAINPTNNELSVYYNANLNNFMQPEQREVWQKIFENKADAEEFYNSVVKLDFNQALKTKDLVNMGEIDPKATFTEKSVVQAISNTKAKNIAKPVQSSVGWHVFLVNKVIAAKPLSFANAKNKVYNELYNNKLQQYQQKIENELSKTTNAKQAFANIIKTYNASSFAFNSIAETDKPENGLNQDIVQTVFNLNTTKTSSLLEDQNGNLYVVNLTKIDPTKLQSIKEAKKYLVALWQEDLIAKKLQQLNDKTMADILSGKDIKSLGFKANTITISRMDNNSVFDAKTTEMIFSQNPNLKLKRPINGNTAENLLTIAVVNNVTNNNTQFLNPKTKQLNASVKQFLDATENFNLSANLNALEQELSKRNKIVVNEKAINSRFQSINAGAQ